MFIAMEECGLGTLGAYDLAPYEITWEDRHVCLYLRRLIELSFDVFQLYHRFSCLSAILSCKIIKEMLTHFVIPHSPPFRKVLFAQLAIAIHYLHTIGIVHRD